MPARRLKACLGLLNDPRSMPRRRQANRVAAIGSPILFRWICGFADDPITVDRIPGNVAPWSTKF